jgi:hypothetical protein
MFSYTEVLLLDLCMKVSLHGYDFVVIEKIYILKVN